MPYNLDLPEDLKQAGWKVKIYDKERLEPPHVTILKKVRAWRLSLRDGTFLDPSDKWSQIDKVLKELVEEEWDNLCEAWDRIHPTNPVQSDDDPE